MDYSFELNNTKKDSNFSTGKISEKSPVVEIFSAMMNGEEIGKFGAKADVAAKYIMSLSEKASVGDQTAMSELNEIRRFVVQPKLLQEIKLLGIFGAYKPLEWGDTAYLETSEFMGIEAVVQAEGLDVPTGMRRKKKTPIAPVTVSGGWASNYRELMLGNMTAENQGMEEVKKEIRNKATLYVLETVFSAIENATGVKYFYEAAGLTKTGVDGILTKIRRYGKPNVSADYALLSEFLPWIGYSGTIGSNAITGISQKVLDEISDTGLIGTYNGAVLSEIPNGYNYNKVVNGNYDILLPAGLGIITPAAPVGGVAPIQTFTIGGLTSFSGNSVSDGTVLTRFDLSVAAGVATPDAIGIIHDTQLDQL